MRRIRRPLVFTADRISRDVHGGTRRIPEKVDTGVGGGVGVANDGWRGVGRVPGGQRLVPGDHVVYHLVAGAAHVEIDLVKLSVN